MKARDLMTSHPACCTPEATAQHVARLMEENDCGCIPVVEDDESRCLVGDLANHALRSRLKRSLSRVPRGHPVDTVVEAGAGSVPHGMMGTVEVEFCGLPSMILSGVLRS